MAVESVSKLCRSTVTVSSEIAANPSETPIEICKKLYGHPKPALEDSASTTADRVPASAEDLAAVLNDFDWGPQRPSEFFLRIFYDALQTLKADPMSGMISPPLMGSHGSMPLTVIAPLADIFRHMANLMVRAEKEVIFITCAWSPSLAQRLISQALKELSARAGRRNERVVVKIMYDKAQAAQVINARQVVHPKEFSGKKIELPHPSDIPHLDIEVISFHKPVLGTLHAKFMIIDRKIALIESNNTEDNDNLEMMTHLEGPVVQSLYDSALITWGNELHPPLPTARVLAPQKELGTTNGARESLDVNSSEAREQDIIAKDGHVAQLPEHMPDDPHYDDNLTEEVTRIQSAYSPKANESRLQAINRQLNVACEQPARPTGPEIDANDAFTPYIPISTSSSFPVAIVSRPPYGAPDNQNVYVPQNEAWLSCIHHAKKTVFIQTPDLNATPLHAALLDAVKRGVEITYYVCLGYNDAGELMPGQGGTNEMFATSLMQELSPTERSLLRIHYYVAKDQDHPIHNSFKQRSCHVKILIADDHIGIQGSGNQDTQSWCHSQELNILIDSQEVCRKWRDGLERNQNTAKFGRASEKDGVWRDAHGEEAEGMTKRPSSKFQGYMTGVKGMVKKMHDKGGF